MEISARQQTLLRILLEQMTPVPAETLARRLECSSRTVRYDVEAINSGLKCSLILPSKYGFAINRQLDMSAVLQKINFRSGENAVGQKLIKLLLESGEVDIYAFALDHYVSEQWVSNHVRNTLSQQLEKYALNIRMTRHRILLSGREQNKREYVISKLMVGERLTDYLIVSEPLTPDFEARLGQCLQELLQENHITLDDIFLKNLEVFLRVSFARCAGKHFLEDDEDTVMVPELGDGRTAKDICERLCETIGVSLGEYDLQSVRRGIDVYIRGSISEDTQNRILQNKEFCERIENALIATFRHFDTKVDYSPILQNLTLHCWYLFARINARAWVHSDLTEKLRYGSPFVYELSVYMVFLLEKMFRTRIPYEEIGLVAVHLGSLLDVSDLGGGAVRVVCICSSYGNLRKRLAEQITNLMGTKIEIVGFYQNSREIKGSDYDFAISVERDNSALVDARTVYVGPYISPMDCLNIERWVVYALQRRREKEYSRLVKKYFDEELFVYEADEACSAKEVLHLLAGKMQEKGYVGEDFLPSVLARESLATTAFFKRFAIPHALDVKANETKIAFFHSQRPIDWFGTKVNFVLLLATSGYDESFSKLYEFIIGVMMNKDLYQQMEQCKSYKQLCEFFRDNF